MRTTELDRALEAAQRALSRGDKSRAQIEALLKQKSFDESAVSGALARLEVLGLIDDARLARHIVQTRLSAGPIGRARLMHELSRRGIGAAIAESALSDVDPESERASLERALAQCLDKHRALPPQKRLARAVAALGRMGFDSESIFEAIGRFMENLS